MEAGAGGEDRAVFSQLFAPPVPTRRQLRHSRKRLKRENHAALAAMRLSRP